MLIIKKPKNFSSKDLNNWDKKNKKRNFVIFLCVFSMVIGGELLSLYDVFMEVQFPELLAFNALFGLFITFLTFGVDKTNSIYGQSPSEILRKHSYFFNFLFSLFFPVLLVLSNILSIFCSTSGIVLIYILVLYYLALVFDGLRFLRYINNILIDKSSYNFYYQIHREHPNFKEILNLNEQSVEIYNSCIEERFFKVNAFSRGIISQGDGGVDNRILSLILGSLEDLNSGEQYLILNMLLKATNEQRNNQEFIQYLKDRLQKLVK